MLRATDVAIERVSAAVHESRAFNVAIAELMKLSNVLSDSLAASDASRPSAASANVLSVATRTLLLMLAPLAPHVSAEMWERSVTALDASRSPVGAASVLVESADTLWSADVASFAGSAVSGASVHEQPWPAVGAVAFLDAYALVDDDASAAAPELTVAVQVSGKFRGTMNVPAEAAESDAALEAAVRASAIGERHLEGKVTRRAIVVRKKDGTLLCNVVV